MRVRVGFRLLMLTAVVLPVIAGCAGGGDGVGSQAGTLTGFDGIDQLETGTVVGRLVSLRTGAPVEGVIVAIGGVTAVSGDDGSFTAVHVLTGMQWLTVSDGGHSLLGGPIRVAVAAGANDVGRLVVDTVGNAPPAAPVI